jgi:dihydrodipicolinate synthase/N-acetylneuraminate lyase
MSFAALLAAAVVEIGGPFPLLCTPYAQSGGIDCPTLAKEARFVADAGAKGVIWPPAEEAIKLLSPDEERRGLEAIAAALDGRDVWFAPCCPGTNTADMLRRVAVVEAIAAKHPSLKTTMLVRMANDAKNDADYRRQYDTLAAETSLPVIIQTYNGISPMPSAECLVDLAKRHARTYGWFKVEGTGSDIVPCIKKLVAAKPVVKTVFTGWGGRDWLYHHRRIGTRGVITQRPMYADLLTRIYRALESGGAEADVLFAKFMYLRNLDEVLPSASMRGWNLYVLKKRGIFENTLSRVAKKGGGWKLEDVRLAPDEIMEIDARLDYALSEGKETAPLKCPKDGK